MFKDTNDGQTKFCEACEEQACSNTISTKTHTCVISHPKETSEEWEMEFNKRFTSEWWYGFSAQSPDINKMGIEGIKNFIKTVVLAETRKARYEQWKYQLENIVENHAGKTPEEAIKSVIQLLADNKE